MIVISDTSPLINLACINKIQLLPAIFDQIIIPRSVYEEIVILGKGQPGADIIELATWISVKDCISIEQVNEFRKELDQGEAEALTLAIELDADILLMDEFKGRSIARQKEIRVIGLLGILLEAKKKNLIQNVKIEMDKLISEANFWISQELYTEVLKSASEI